MSAKKERPAQGGALPANPSQRDLAAFTGMSTRQIWQAKKIADIPAEEFDRLVESDNPPTVTELLKVARQRDGLATTESIVPYENDALTDPNRDRASYQATLGWAFTDPSTIQAYQRCTGEDVAPVFARYREWAEENLIGPELSQSE